MISTTLYMNALAHGLNKVMGGALVLTRIWNQRPLPQELRIFRRHIEVGPLEQRGLEWTLYAGDVHLLTMQTTGMCQVIMWKLSADQEVLTDILCGAGLCLRKRPWYSLVRILGEPYEFVNVVQEPVTVR